MPDGVVEATINGIPVRLEKGVTRTIFEAAADKGIVIPTICHMPPQEPAGVCRVCVVELKPPPGSPPPKDPKLVPACAQRLDDKMIVETDNAVLRTVRRTLVELLMADHPTPCQKSEPGETETPICELEQRAEEFHAKHDRYEPAVNAKTPFVGWEANDDSHPNILVNHAACIVCDRCVRGCTDEAKNFVIGRAGKGNDTVITFDDGHHMGASSCVSCGECMASCPTGALTNRGGFRSAKLKGSRVSAKRLLQMDVAARAPDGQRIRLFEGISEKYLKKILGDDDLLKDKEKDEKKKDLGRNENAVVERHFSKGQHICEMGKEGSTAFFIVSGRVKVWMPPPQAVQSVASPLRRLLLGMGSKIVPDTREDRPIPVDATIDLDPHNPVTERGPGELFGEMTCLNMYPRAATVTALEDTVVIEMLRPVLLMLMRSKRFGPYLDQLYRENSLDALRGDPMFKKVGAAFFDELRPKLELIRYKPGEVIFEQGEEAKHFFLVRVGFVKVTRKLPGGDVVLAYRGRGEFFGEIGLLDEVDRKRTATCSAADHVDVVRIPRKDFEALLARDPTVDRQVRQAAEERKKTYRPDPFIQSHGKNVDELVRQGLMEAQSLLLLDLDRCTRCDLCAQACATAHDDGVTRLVREGLRVIREVPGERGPDDVADVGRTVTGFGAKSESRYEHYLVATSCRQCRDPLCMFGCPVGSIRRTDMQITIENWCIGCGVCADNCPYGNINMVTLPGAAKEPKTPGHSKAGPLLRATACDLCHSLSPTQDPSCVVACPHGAAIRVMNVKEFFGVDEPQRPAR